MNPNFNDLIVKFILERQRESCPKPKRIFTDSMRGVTVVLWDDGTKTIVRLCEGDLYDPYAAFCAAFTKKWYGSNSAIKNTVEKLTVYHGISNKDLKKFCKQQ